MLASVNHIHTHLHLSRDFSGSQCDYLMSVDFSVLIVHLCQLLGAGLGVSRSTGFYLNATNYSPHLQTIWLL